MHILIYTSNFVYRNRTTFYFFKSYFNGASYDNANQFNLTCWSHIEEIFW